MGQQQEPTTVEISATEVQAQTSLTLLQDKSNLRTNSGRRVEGSSVVHTKSTGTQGTQRKKALTSTDKTVKPGSVGKQSQSLQKTTRKGNKEGPRGGGVRGKVNTSDVKKNVKIVSEQDKSKVKQIPRKVQVKGGAVIGKEAQENITQTKNRYCYLL